MQKSPQVDFLKKMALSNGQQLPGPADAEARAQLSVGRVRRLRSSSAGPSPGRRV